MNLTLLPEVSLYVPRYTKDISNLNVYLKMLQACKNGLNIVAIQETRKLADTTMRAAQLHILYLLDNMNLVLDELEIYKEEYPELLV